ncbi:hypothetical protein AALP_AA8G267300 [Arabis alpina]|uniref:Uncharacterized protein n=1 Tax=Arabis alpina TaxID=50452 RepID=A0A087G9N1_ARAAL|nr:hypothetical protein AALP_AA8G267300 [Arabis alpina]
MLRFLMSTISFPEDPTCPVVPDSCGTDVIAGLGANDPTYPQRRTEDLGVTDAPRSLPCDFEASPPTTLYRDNTNHPGSSHGYVGTNDDSRGPGDLSFLDDECPNLPPNRADASSSSSPSDSRAFSIEGDDEDVVDEVEETKKVASTQKVKVRPDPSGSTLSKKESLQRLQEKCRISEDIELVVPSSVDRADAPPPRYLTLFENYFDQCLLWFPLLGFLMRFLAAHSVCLSQINPRGIRHLIGIYVLSRECGVDITTEHLSYLTDFRVRDRSDELKHSVTNTSGMALIVGFASKDDHSEDRFFFVEISEKTVEADNIGLELSSGNGEWKESFSLKRIKSAFSAEIIPGKILGRGRARVSSREQAALESAAKAARSSGADAPKAVVSMSSTPTATFAHARSSMPMALKTPSASTLLLPPSLTPDELTMQHRQSEKRARLSSGKEKGIDYGTPSKKQRVDTHPGVVVEREVSARLAIAPSVSGLLRDEAYAATKSKASKSTRIGEAVTDARDEMTRGFAGRVNEVAGLLTEIGRKVQNNMLNLAEIDANLEFIELLQGSSPPDHPTEIKALHERRRPIYDARDVFGELLDNVREVLEIPEDFAADEVDDEADDEADEEL